MSNVRGIFSSKLSRQVRRRTVIETLKTSNNEIGKLNHELVQRLQFCIKVMKKISEEKNWAVKVVKEARDDAQMVQEEETDIVWVGEGEPTTIIEAALKRLRIGKEFQDEQAVAGPAEPAVGDKEEGGVPGTMGRMVDSKEPAPKAD